MSKWFKYDTKIDRLLGSGRSDWSQMAREILGDVEYSKVDALRKYIKRRSKKETEVTNTSTTKSNEYSTPFQLSAWDEDGTIMDIDKYCEHHGLPREDITSYKLITHSKNPFYNTVFKEIKGVIDESFDLSGAIEDALTSLNISVSNKLSRTPSNKVGDEVTRLIYTDTHIAMDTDSEGTSMYPTVWNRESILETFELMCAHTIANRNGTTLYIDDLGDFLDGWNGETTRKSHPLPQNMNNKEAFSLGLEVKMLMLERLTPYFNEIVCTNVCNDNHAGDFASILNHSFMMLAHSKYENVIIRNYNKFIEHYYIGKHAIVLTHGKDKKSLKFGFKPKLDPVQIEKIEVYLKHNEHGSVHKEAEFIEFSKGDSHLMLFDYSSAQDFFYFNYPAISPSSEWVQSNFKKGQRGFVIQLFNSEEINKTIIPILL